jgi:hypothetical protein
MLLEVVAPTLGAVLSWCLAASPLLYLRVMFTTPVFPLPMLEKGLLKQPSNDRAGGRQEQ